MKAVTCTNAKLEVVDRRPGAGQGSTVARCAAVRYLRIGPACPLAL